MHNSIHIRLATTQDESCWNSYVQQHTNPSPYHLFSWKKAIETAYKFESLYFIALNTDNKIVGILPSILLKKPFITATLCSLPYCDRGEALVDSNEVLDLLITKTQQHAKQLGVSYYEYRSTQKDYFDLSNHDEKSSIKVRMLLSLPSTSEELLKGFKTKLRSQINKSIKNGLTYETGSSPQLIKQFFSIFSKNMRDLGSPTHSLKWFESIQHEYGDNCIISIVKNDNTPIGAGIVLLVGTVATIPWASTLRDFNRLSPNMLLYWSLLKQSTDLGYKYFDFGRSSINEGTFKFKKQWGAQPIALEWLEYKNNVILQKNKNTSLNGNNKLRQSVEKIWRHLPLALTIKLGSHLRKYISL